MNIRDSLARLVGLQAAEIELRRLEATLATLPAERQALRSQVEAARITVTVAEAAREDGLKQRRRLEGELKDAEAKLDKYREHEMQVKTNEQLWALQGEMRTAAAKISAIETGILEEMERVDVLQRQIDQAKTELANDQRRVAEALAEIDADDARMRAQAAADRQQIAELRLLISDGLDVYDRIKSARAGIGISEVTEAGNCSACQVRLRPQITVEANKMEGLVQCDNCKRLLVSRSALELPASVQVTAD